MNAPIQRLPIRQFVDQPIQGVIVRTLSAHHDSRGWLMELHREDEAAGEPVPAMMYASMTLPGIARGPHEHIEQTDRFCFFGPSDFLVVLWDNRPTSPTFNYRMKLVAGQSSPRLIVVPNGVVHGYRNIGTESGLILNLPNQLYRGRNRQQKVDEIRHERDPETPFRLDD